MTINTLRGLTSFIVIVVVGFLLLFVDLSERQEIALWMLFILSVGLLTAALVLERLEQML